MHPSEIAQRTTWDACNLGHLVLPVPMIADEIPFVLFAEPDAEPRVSAKMAATIWDGSARIRKARRRNARGL